MNKNSLRAQALAIVMVVLVVASIIGIALFSRMAKDKRLVVEEQNSAASAQAAEGVLDVLVGADIDKLESWIDSDNGTIVGFEGIKDFIGTYLGLQDSANALPDDGDWCPGAETGEENTSIELQISKVKSDEYPEVKPGMVRSYNLQGATFNGDPCILEIGIRAQASQAVFAVKKVYDPASGTLDEFNGYYALANNSGSFSNAMTIPETSLSTLTWDPEDLDYEYPPIDLIAEYNSGLREIRIIPLNGTIAVSTFLDEGRRGVGESCVSKSFFPVKVTADANCQTSSNAYEMVLPGSGNLGYAPLFDFGIYDNGGFRLKH